MNREHFEDYIGSLSEEELENLTEALETKAKGSRRDKEEEAPFPSVSDDFTVIRGDKVRKGRDPVKAKKNLWKDTGELGDVETPEFSKTPRNRQKPSRVGVECHVCGKSFKMSKSLIYGEFVRCNRCTGK
jgi:hypothetical protein